MKEMTTVELVARYDRDTKRMHRYLVESEHGIAGSIYINKSAHPLPKRIVLELKNKADQ